MFMSWYLDLLGFSTAVILFWGFFQEIFEVSHVKILEKSVARKISEKLVNEKFVKVENKLFFFLLENFEH